MPNKPPITDRPAVIFLSAVVAAFVAGVTAWIFLANHIEEKARAAVLELKKNNELPEGPQGPVGPQGPTSASIPIGSVIASLIEPKKFAELYGDQWVLADGGDIIGTPLSAVIRKESIPDLGGKFLRGINTKNDPKTQDPDGQRPPGQFQSDAVGPHKHHSKKATGNYHPPASNSAIVAIDTYVDEPTSESIAPNGVESRPRNIAVFYYVKVK